MLVARHEAAAVDEHQYRRVLRPGLREHVQPVARVGAVSEVARDLDAGCQSFVQPGEQRVGAAQHFGRQVAAEAFERGADLGGHGAVSVSSTGLIAAPECASAKARAMSEKG